MLKVSPSLLEHTTAARRISALAVGNPATTPIGTVYEFRPIARRAITSKACPSARGGLLVRHNFPLDATYEFNVVLLQNIVGYVPGWVAAPAGNQHRWCSRLRAPVGGDEDNKLSDTNLAQTKETLDRRLRTRAGQAAARGGRDLHSQELGARRALQPFTRNLDLQNMNGVPIINFMRVTGPFAATGPATRPAVAGSSSARPRARRRRRARGAFCRRSRGAYRRPPTDAEVDGLLAFFETGRRRVGTFDGGIEEALTLLLASPTFLFRAEPDPPRIAAGAIYPVSDLEMASRLSFFLWSTIPDDELLNVAAQGKLKDPARWRSRCGARRPAVEGARRQLRRAVAVPAQPAELRARQRRVPELGR